jgi:hypothetical protein
VAQPTCKKDVQKLIGKINYLRWFIANVAGKVDSFLPLVRLKQEDEFVWGEVQKEAFDKIKRYLRSPPVLRAPKEGKEFSLYVVSHERMIGAMSTPEDGGKEYVIAYLSEITRCRSQVHVH